MVKAVVVNRDQELADRQADILRGAGYEVEMCDGPERLNCPVLTGLPCPVVDRADVLVYDAWIAGSSDGGKQLIAELRDTYADLPIVLTSVDRSLDWVETEGPHRVTPLVGEASEEAILMAVSIALADQGMAV
jgi:hypothetical protein